jgi:NDP-sugar pyrophosphorylase family protein
MGRGLSGAIIAAGRGERLRATVAGVPKPLVKLGGETLLARQAREMRAAGLDPIHVIVNTETARLMRDFAIPVETDLLVRDTANSMESLLALGERIAPGRFALATVDAVLGPGRLDEFLARAMAATDPSRDRFDGALGVVRWRGDRHPLFVQVAADGLITDLGEKRTDIVTAGVYLFASGIFDYSDEARRLGLDALRRFLGLLIERGTRFAAVELDQVIDVDEGADLDAASAMLARRGGGK